MKTFVLLAILLTLVVGAAHADETAVTTGVRTEGGTVYPYTATYVDASRDVGGQPFTLRIESTSRGVRYLFVNYGSLSLLKSDDLKVTAFPGVMATDGGSYYGGGNILIEAPKLRLTAFLQEMAGNKGHRRLWLTSLQLTDWLALRHSHFAHTGSASTHFLGPAVETKIGDAKVWLWGGPCLNQPGGWSVDGRITIKF